VDSSHRGTRRGGRRIGGVEADGEADETVGVDRRGGEDGGEALDIGAEGTSMVSSGEDVEASPEEGSTK